MSVKPFSAGHTLESLRDSDFDSCSALGEVVDNSIQANAKTVPEASAKLVSVVSLWPSVACMLRVFELPR